jgi:hypothetical protein
MKLFIAVFILIGCSLNKPQNPPCFELTGDLLETCQSLEVERLDWKKHLKELTPIKPNLPAIIYLKPDIIENNNKTGEK